MRIVLIASLIATSFAACQTNDSSDLPVGSAVARITQVPPQVGCVSITAAGNRTVTNNFDVTPGQSALLHVSNLPVGSLAFTASAYGNACNAIGMAQPTWSSTAPFFAPVTPGGVTSLTLTLVPTGGANIGIDFSSDGGVNIDGGVNGDGGVNIDGGGPNDLSPSRIDGGSDLASAPADLAHITDLAH
ncbi:MAG: Tryptophan synthase alpha chain [Myxococcales bacterium]|nr:Tryptophan synthase alpha chain [Myxococcales bacterium]